MTVERPGAAVQPRRPSSGAEESARLSALRSYCVLETGREARFDDLTCLASTICETPVSLVSLVDTNRLFFKSRSEEHTSELQSRLHLVCRLLLEKKKNDRHDN